MTRIPFLSSHKSPLCTRLWY